MPLELVYLDFLSLETAVGGYDSILVVTDLFTRSACAYPTRNQEAKTVAKIPCKEFVVHHCFVVTMKTVSVCILP